MINTSEVYFEKPTEDMYISNITPEVQKSITNSKVKNGIATVFIGCSTASITTIENSEETINRLKKVLEAVAPVDYNYEHHTTSADMYGVGGDNNGNSHVRSSLVGPSVTVPFSDGKLLLDKNQNIVLLDFDLIKRKRKVVIQIMGE